MEMKGQVERPGQGEKICPVKRKARRRRRWRMGSEERVVEGEEGRCKKEEEIRKDEAMRKKGDRYRVVNDASSSI